MKKLFALLIMLSIAIGIMIFPAAAEENAIKVALNGTNIEFDQSPILHNNRTMVPMRAIFEALGFSVNWDDETQTISSVKDNEITITMQIDSNKMYVNGTEIELDVPPMLLNQRTLVPVRAISESVGIIVSWNEAFNSVYLRDTSYFVAELEIENMGTIKLLLYPGAAPSTVLNFANLVESGFYNGLTFHRVIKDFMIQGGDPDGNGTGGPGYGIVGEFLANGYENYISHARGIISMARAQDYNSAGSQFFIVHRDSVYLDGQYAAFGEVIEGMDIVDKIAETETDESDMPLTPVVIKSARMIYDNAEEIDALLAEREAAQAEE